jgi:gamma-glutamyltranspeptidase/glutathione hydrolase/leukotriene-C4 hydrolase
MLENPDWQAIFAPKGVFLREGEVIRRTNLSRTLEAIAEGGSEAFYKVSAQ